MTDGFSAQWLALRENSDIKSRSLSLATDFLASLLPRAQVIDLGAGTGANARYLDKLATDRAQKIAWRLIDQDKTLLDCIDGLPDAARIVLDFAADPALLDLDGVDGISASALFDLVSRDWFARFVTAAARRPLLLALTVHDAHRWYPAYPADVAVMGWFARDMRRDKGFGPAMGLAAPKMMAESLVEAGYEIQQSASDWRLGSEEPALLNAMVDGIAAAATAYGDSAYVAGWRDRRRLSVADGRLKLIVGHRDILALHGTV